MTKKLDAERLGSLEEPGSATGYWFYDARLYAELVEDMFDTEFDPAAFEEYLDLEPLNQDGTIFDILPDYLDIDSTIWEKPTIQAQVAHYLERYDIPHTDRLSYLICRLSDFSILDDPTELYDIPGLDMFSRGVLTSYQLACMCGVALQWTRIVPRVDETLKLLETNYEGFIPMSWSRSDLLPDMTAAYRHNPFMSELYSGFSSIAYPHLLPVYSELWHRGHSNKITGSLVQEAVTCTRRESYNIARTVDMLCCKRWMPSLEGLGLRYRIMLTPTFRPRAWNSGLLRVFEIINPTYSGMFTYLEPVGSFGPPDGVPQDGTLQVVVEPQFVSYRLDLIDDGEWMFEPWNPRFSAVAGQDDLWLQEPFPHDGESVTFTERSITLFGMLWSYRGSPSRESLLYELMEYPTRTAKRHRNQFEDAGLMKTIQYPKLCFTGLQDGVFILVNDSDPEDIGYLAEYVPAVSPYCEVYFDTQKSSFWSMSRIPGWRADIFQRVVGDHLDEKGIQCVMGHTINEECFRMTVPPRLYDLELGIFSDPWL